MLEALAYFIYAFISLSLIGEGIVGLVAVLLESTLFVLII